MKKKKDLDKKLKLKESDLRRKPRPPRPKESDLKKKLLPLKLKE